MAYNLQDLQSAVVDDLKDPSFSLARITRYLNYGQLAIFNKRMLKFTQKPVTSTLTIGAYTVNQQTDHQSTIGGALVNASNVVVFELSAATYQPHGEFFENYPAPNVLPNACPSAWTEFGSQIYFNAPVDKAYTFNQRYYRIPTTLANPADVPTAPEAFRELLELYAEFRAEGYRGNHDIAKVLEGQFDQGLEDMTIRFGAMTSVAAPVMRGATRRVNA